MSVHSTHHSEFDSPSRFHILAGLNYPELHAEALGRKLPPCAQSRSQRHQYWLEDTSSTGRCVTAPTSDPLWITVCSEEDVTPSRWGAPESETSQEIMAMRKIGRLVAVLFLAMALLSVLGCAATDTRQAPGEYFDDSVITAKVKTAIFNDPELKVMEIKVETFRGEVQLSGFVSSQDAAKRAVEVTRGVAGVTSVKNDMQVK